MEIDVGEGVLRRFVSDTGMRIVDPRSIVEAVRVAEGTVGILRLESERLRERAERLSRFGLAAVAGLLAALGLVNAYGVAVPPIGRICLAAGTGIILLSVAILSSIVAGFGQSGSADAPRVEVLMARLDEQGWTLVELQWSLLATLARAVRDRERAQAEGARRVARAYVVLMMGVVLVLLGFAFILGGGT